MEAYWFQSGNTNVDNTGLQFSDFNYLIEFIDFADEAYIKEN